MKKVFIFLGLIIALFADAQTISVSSFKLLDTDLTANTSGTMETDQNGETAALIKVVTTQTGFTFDGGALGIVKTVQKPSEVWVYVPRGLKKITISHPQLGMLRDYYLNIPIEAARTYEMILVTGEVQTTIKQVRSSQYVVFQLSPTNAVVELEGELLQTRGGTATKMMKFGTYNYRVQAPNYLSEAGNVTVNDPKNKHIVKISLKPNISVVTFNVDNNAEIWINGEMIGKGSWTGNLGAGTYEIETKKASHRTASITKDISVTPDPQIFNLQSPIPIYGEAEINSSPAMADIYIDEKKVGKTPQVVSDLLIGKHVLKIKKEGFITESSDLLIEEGKILDVNILLQEQKQIESKLISVDNTSPVASDKKILNKILDAKNYSVAYNLISQNLSKLSNQDRAAAYNKLVDLSMADFDYMATIIAKNEQARSNGKKEEYEDYNLLRISAYYAVLNGIKCDTYDQMPDQNGTISPKYAEFNAQRLWLEPRKQLAQAGIHYSHINDEASALKYWSLFVESDSAPLFKDCDRQFQESYFEKAAYLSAYYAYKLNDLEKAIRFCDIAMKNSSLYEDCRNLKSKILAASKQ